MADSNIKIIQVFPQHGGMYGLGEDSKVYRYDPYKSTWVKDTPPSEGDSELISDDDTYPGIGQHILRSNDTLNG